MSTRRWAKHGWRSSRHPPIASGSNQQQQLVAEARRFLSAGGRFDFNGLFDAGQLLAKSKIPGAALELNHIRDILLLADKAAEWREWLSIRRNR